MGRHSKNEIEWETSGERGVVEVVPQSSTDFVFRQRWSDSYKHMSFHFPFSNYNLE